MNWSEYKNHYSDFLAAMFRSEVITFYADRAIPNMEVKQPESEKSKLPFLASYSRRQLASIAGGYRTDHGMMDAFAGLIFDQQKERFISYQELPLILAHLEAFLGHSLIALWETNPTLLTLVADHRERLKTTGLSSNPADWSPSDLGKLIEATLFDVFRKTLDRFSNYVTVIGIALTTNFRPLVVADLKRNLIIHNGGIVNNKFLGNLNAAERRSAAYAVGQHLPINYDDITTVFNHALQLAEELFTQVSTQFLGESTPLKNNERVYTRQSLHMQSNPLEAAAQQAVRKLGGPDAVLSLILKLRAKGMSEGEISTYIIQLGNSDSAVPTDCNPENK